MISNLASAPSPTSNSPSCAAVLVDSLLCFVHNYRRHPQLQSIILRHFSRASLRHSLRMLSTIGHSGLAQTDASASEEDLFCALLTAMDQLCASGHAPLFAAADLLCLPFRPLYDNENEENGTNIGDELRQIRFMFQDWLLMRRPPLESGNLLHSLFLRPSSSSAIHPSAIFPPPPLLPPTIPVTTSSPEFPPPPKSQPRSPSPQIQLEGKGHRISQVLQKLTSRGKTAEAIGTEDARTSTPAPVSSPAIVVGMNNPPPVASTLAFVQMQQFFRQAAIVAIGTTIQQQQQQQQRMGGEDSRDEPMAEVQEEDKQNEGKEKRTNPRPNKPLKGRKKKAMKRRRKSSSSSRIDEEEAEAEIPMEEDDEEEENIGNGDEDKFPKSNEEEEPECRNGMEDEFVGNSPFATFSEVDSLSERETANSRTASAEIDEDGQIKHFFCPLPNCQKRFANKFLLKKHQFIHSGQKPHICQYCKKPFNRKDNLLRHKKTHLQNGMATMDGSIKRRHNMLKGITEEMAIELQLLPMNRLREGRQQLPDKKAKNGGRQRDENPEDRKKLMDMVEEEEDVDVDEATVQ